jgi:HEAT repeat protein
LAATLVTVGAAARVSAQAPTSSLTPAVKPTAVPTPSLAPAPVPTAAPTPSTAEAPRAPIAAVPSTSPAPAERPLDAVQDEAHLARLADAVVNDASYKVRLQAAVFLGRSNEERAFEPLVAALSSDEHYTVRAAAATALANLNDPRGISHIIKRIATDADPFVREEATRALNKFDRQQAVPYVVATYGSDNVEVRKQAVGYLALSPDDAADQVLIRALGDVEEIFIVAKGAILAQPPAEIMPMMEEALDHRDAAVRRGAVRVLHGMGTADAATQILKVYDRDIEADGVRNETRKALRDLRRFLPVDNVIKDAQANPQKHARAKALKLLGVLGGDQAEKVLMAALDDQDVYLRGTAVMAMAELGNPAVVPSLEKLEADPANQRILHLVRHTLKQLRKKQPGE